MCPVENHNLKKGRLQLPVLGSNLHFLHSHLPHPSAPPLTHIGCSKKGAWGYLLKTQNSRPRLRYSGTNRRPVPSNPYPAGLRRLPAPRDLSTASLREKRSSQPWSISTRAAVGVEGIGAGTRATGEEEHVRRQPGPTCPAPGGLGS